MSDVQRTRVDRLGWWQAVHADPRVRGATHHVALALSSYGTERIFPSMAELVESTGLASQTVRHHRSQLVRLGYLSQTSQAHRGHVAEYRLAMPIGAPQRAPLVDEGAPQQAERRSPASALPQGPEIPLPPSSDEDADLAHQWAAEARANEQMIPTDSADARDLRDRAAAAISLADLCRDARPNGAQTAGWTDAAVNRARGEAVAHGISDQDADAVLLALAADREAGVPSAIRNLDCRRRAEASIRARRPAVPDWCGECDPEGERNPGQRMRYDEKNMPFRCPKCHPNVAENAAA